MLFDSLLDLFDLEKKYYPFKAIYCCKQSSKSGFLHEICCYFCKFDCEIFLSSLHENEIRRVVVFRVLVWEPGLPKFRIAPKLLDSSSALLNWLGLNKISKMAVSGDVVPHVEAYELSELRLALGRKGRSKKIMPVSSRPENAIMGEDCRLGSWKLGVGV